MKTSSYNIIVGIVILAVVQISCSTTSSVVNENPAWVDNPRSVYSPTKYLLAVGSGSTLKEAESDAFASLSQIFQQDIQASKELQDELVETTRNNKEIFTEGTTKLLNNVTIGTNQKLMNSVILESEMGTNGTYYALAGMDKLESARIYNQEIANNELKINELETNADNENNILQKLILLKKARVLATANENLLRQYNILRSGVSETQSASETLSRIDEKFRKIQQSAAIRINANNVSTNILSAVSEVFQRAGFNISEQQDSAVLEVSVKYDAQKAELNRDDAEFVKWELAISILDLQTNRAFNSFFTEGRDGALSYQDALKRADFTARKNIESQFNTFLNQELLATN